MIEAARAELVRLQAEAAPLEPGRGGEGGAGGGGDRPCGAISWKDLPDGPTYRGWRGLARGPARSRNSLEEGRPAEAALAYLDRCVDRPGITTASPRFMGYVPGGGLFHSAIGDFLAAASNKYAGFAPAAPGAVRLENATTAWLARVIGFPGRPPPGP